MSNFLSKVGNVIGEMITAVYEQVEKYDKFYLISMELGWPPAMNRTKHVEESLQIVKEYEKDGLDHVKGMIESAMIRWHDKNYLKEMFREWATSPLLRPRIHILKAVLDAHLRGEYILSIPAMLPQIEGVVVSGLDISGRMSSRKFEEYIDSLQHEAIVIKNKNNALRRFVTAKLMAPFVHGRPVENSPSRHAILHGADLHYGSEANSLKLILFMENIRQLFRFETIDGSRLFHVYGCPSLKQSRRKRIFFSNRMEAARSGLAGCKRCGADKYLW